MSNNRKVLVEILGTHRHAGQHGDVPRAIPGRRLAFAGALASILRKEGGDAIVQLMTRAAVDHISANTGFDLARALLQQFDLSGEDRQRELMRLAGEQSEDITRQRRLAREADRAAGRF
jgi:hypothetical protein